MPNPKTIHFLYEKKESQIPFVFHFNDFDLGQNVIIESGTKHVELRNFDAIEIYEKVGSSKARCFFATEESKFLFSPHKDWDYKDAANYKGSSVRMPSIEFADSANRASLKFTALPLGTGLYFDLRSSSLGDFINDQNQFCFREFRYCGKSYFAERGTFNKLFSNDAPKKVQHEIPVLGGLFTAGKEVSLSPQFFSEPANQDSNLRYMGVKIDQAPSPWLIQLEVNNLIQLSPVPKRKSVGLAISHWLLRLSILQGGSLGRFLNTKIFLEYQNALGLTKPASPASAVATLGETDWDLEYYFKEKGGSSKASLCCSRIFPAKAPSVTATYNNFLTHSGEPLQADLVIAEPTRQEAADPTDPFNEPLRIEYEVQKVELPAVSCRMGALDLHLGGSVELDPGEKEGVYRWTSPNAWSIEERAGQKLSGDLAGDFQKGAWEFEGKIFFPVQSFTPGSQDPTPVEDPDLLKNPDQGLVFFPKAKQEPKTGTMLPSAPIYLDCAEKVDRTSSREFSVRLERNTRSTALAPVVPSRVIVLQARPFLVAAVEPNIDLTKATEIGTWSGTGYEGPSWKLLDAAVDSVEGKGGGMHLILPPQAVGEEAVKFYTHDNPNLVVSPDKPIRYLFSPNAELLLARSVFEQRYTEAPWNLRRLMGWPGQRLAGAPIRNLFFEMLYGLTVTVEREDLVLQEAESRLGFLRRLLDFDDLPHRLFQWKNQRFVEWSPKTGAKSQILEAIKSQLRQHQGAKHAFSRRLASLDPSQAWLTKGILTLDTGVSFAFRPGRDCTHPLTGNPLRPDGKLDGGLKGGVDWAFESKNIYEEVIQSGPSSSGLISGLSLTSLGATGHQKASFANDKSKVISDAYLGRTFFYSLERIGRIGITWNRAKHVIVYERTVLDSSQFADETPGKAWLGRAILRKTQEYVELLQPVRHYPEFGEPQAHAGMVRACQFGTTKIFVDSRWGRDIPGGWEIPLHKPGFYLNPKLGQKPLVQFHLAAHQEDQEKDAQSQELTETTIEALIENPENLYFSTSTNPKTTADTDRWDPIPITDFPIGPIGRDEPETGFDATNPDRTLADSSAIPSGLERYSFRINTRGKEANIGHGRTEKSMGVAPETITFARHSLKLGITLADAAFDGKPNEVEKIFKDALKAFDATPIAQASGAAPSAKDYVDSLTTAIQKKLIDTVGKGLGAKVQETATWYQCLEQKMGKQEENWKENWAKLCDPNVKELKVIGDQWNEIRSLAEKDAINQLAQFLAPFSNQLQSATSKLLETRERFRKAENSLDDFLKSLDSIRTGLTAEGERFAAKTALQVQNELVPTEEALSRIIGHGLEKENEIQGQLAKLRELLPPSIASLIPSLKIPSLTNKIEAVRQAASSSGKELETKIKDLLEAAFADLLQAGTPFYISLDVARNKLKDPWIKEIEKGIKSYEDSLKNFKQWTDPNALAKVILKEISGFEDFKKALGLLGQEGGTIGKFEVPGILNQFGEAKDCFKGLEGQLNQIRKDAGAWADDFSKIADDAQSNLANFVSDAKVNLTKDLEKNIQSRVTCLTNDLRGAFDSELKEVREVADVLRQSKSQAQEIADLGSSTLTTLRAFGKGPVTEALKLNREKIGYYFTSLADGKKPGDILRSTIDITPCTALLNRWENALDKGPLKSLGIRLPTASLAERFLPAIDLPDIKDLFPDFGGIKLDGLLSKVKLPQRMRDNIRVSHGVDRQTKRAWAKADVNVLLDGKNLLFDFKFIAMQQRNALFKAQATLEADASGNVRRKVSSRLSADWILDFGGNGVMTLKDAALTYDDAKGMDFDFDPKKIQFHPCMQFLTDLMDSLGGQYGGFTIGVLRQGDMPCGVNATYSAELPALQTGAFSISNIRLGAFFELCVTDGFYLASGVALSSPDRPFFMTILFLGGGGWVNLKIKYYPLKKKIAHDLSIGLAAGAALPFDIGVARGGVYFFVGISIESHGGSGQPLTIILSVTLSGYVCLLGIVSISMLMGMQATYQGGSLTCTGILKAKVKICRFFSISVSKSVSYQLAGAKKSSSSGPDAVAMSVDATSLQSLAVDPDIDYAVDNYYHNLA